MQPPSVPLESLLEHSFIPQHIPRASTKSARSYRSQYRTAVKRLSQMLGRRAMVADLSTETLNALEQYLTGEGLGTSARGNLRCRLRTLWRHAHKAGFTDAPAREQRRKRRRRRRELAPGKVTGDVDLEDYLTSRVLPLSTRVRSEKTAKRYHSTVRNFARYWRETRRPDQPTRPTLDCLADSSLAGFMHWVVGRGRSEATANSGRRSLVKIWNFAWRRHEKEVQPRVEPFPPLKRVRRTWTPAEFQLLLTTASESPGVIDYDVRGLDPHTRRKRIPAGLWWFSLLLTIGTTGSRIGATMALRWRGIDVDRGTILMPAETQKNRCDMQYILPQLLAATFGLLRNGAGDEELVWPWPLDGGGNETDCWRQLIKGLREILKRAGLRRGSKDLFHCVRSMVGTWVADGAGLEVAQQYLGHSSPAVTKLYLDPSQMSTHRSAVHLLPEFTTPLVELPAVEPIPETTSIADVLRQALAIVENDGVQTRVPRPKSALSYIGQNGGNG
jgi:integrase